MKKLNNKKKKSPIQIVLDVIGYGIILVIFSLIVSVAVQSFMGKQPNLFGYYYYYIETDSMNGDNEDSFSSKTVIISKMIDEEDCYTLKVGDIITFKPEDLNLPSYVTTKTHRIVSIDYQEKTIVTKGDANELNDATISFSNVKAKYVYQSKLLTGLYSIFRSFWGFLILIFIPITFLIISQIYTFLITIRKEKLNKEINEIESENLRLLEDKKKEIEEKAIKEFLEKNKKND